MKQNGGFINVKVLYLVETVECYVYFCMHLNRICVFLCSILLAMWTLKFSFRETDGGREECTEGLG